MSTRPPGWVRVHRVEFLAALVGVLLVVAAAAVVHGGHPRPHAADGQRRAPEARRSARPTAGGAVHAATSYLLALGDAALAGPRVARRTVDAVATGPLQVELANALPALAASVRARVTGGHAPSAFDGWPLGYRLLSFDGSGATVAVWHLDIASSSALRLISVDYATTTYGLKWLAGAWRIQTATTQPGPTPPAADATPAELDSFARAATSFSPYRYVP